MEKCITFGCTNHKHEGQFVGDLCSPCYNIITTGQQNPSNAWFIKQLSAAQAEIKHQRNITLSLSMQKEELQRERATQALQIKELREALLAMLHDEDGCVPMAEQALSKPYSDEALRKYVASEIQKHNAQRLADIYGDGEV